MGVMMMQDTKTESQGEAAAVGGDALAIANKALLLAARWFKLNYDDDTLSEHPPSKADLAGMFDAMQEAREQIRACQPSPAQLNQWEIPADFDITRTIKLPETKPIISRTIRRRKAAIKLPE